MLELNILVLATPASLRKNASKEIILGAVKGSQDTTIMTLPSMEEHVKEFLPLNGNIQSIPLTLIENATFHLVIYSKDLTSPETLQTLYLTRKKGATLVELPTVNAEEHIDTFYTSFSNEHYTDSKELIIPVDKIKENFEAMRLEKFELPMNEPEYMKILVEGIAKQFSPNDTYYVGVEVKSDVQGQFSIYFAPATVDTFKTMCMLANAHKGIPCLYERKQVYTKAQAITRAKFIQRIEQQTYEISTDRAKADKAGTSTFGGITVDFHKKD